MKKRVLLTFSALSLSLAAWPMAAHADAETEALRAHIKRLEARLDELERRESQRENAYSRLAPAAGPVSGTLEKRLAVVERKQELAEDDSKAKAEKNPTVEIGKGKGLSVTSADKQYSLQLRAYAQADSRTFVDNSNASNASTFLIRTARPVLDAKMTDYFAARIVMDFGSGSTRLPDAYLDFRPMPQSNYVNLRLGKFKTPMGLERWQSEQEINFVERGMPTNLVPSRDIGVMAFGDILPDQLEYQLALTNGAPDLVDTSIDTDNGKDITARLFAHPFRWMGIPQLSGFGAGIAGSIGEHQGSSASSNLMDGYRTAAQARFFTYSSGAYADGKQWRVNPQAYYYNGPFGAMGEYIVNAQEVQRTTNHATLRNDAWMGVVNYVLTGEDASFDGVKPAREFNLANGDWGAFEVLGRYSALNVDDKAFANFASLAASAKSARETTLGVTWHLNSSLKINANYSWTSFDGGDTGNLDRETEKLISTRAQFRF